MHTNQGARGTTATFVELTDDAPGVESVVFGSDASDGIAIEASALQLGEWSALFVAKLFGDHAHP